MSAPGIITSAPGTSFGVAAKIWNSERREFISQQHMDIATIIHDYNPYFSLVYVPENSRDASDTKPFAILDSTPGNPPYIMRYLSELEMRDPKEIITWIFMGDQKHHSRASIIQRMEAEEAADRALKLSREQEEIDDQIDLITQVAIGGRDGKHFFRHDGQTYRR